MASSKQIQNLILSAREIENARRALKSSFCDRPGKSFKCGGFMEWKGMELLEGKIYGESLPKGFRVSGGRSSFLATKMKGIFKGFKFISQIFVVKEHEMVIGYPTDVKHVEHIGFSSSSSIPSWMAEFKMASDFSSRVFGESKGLSWASHEFDQPNGFQLSPGKFSDKSFPDADRGSKKKRKKTKSSSSSVRSMRSHTSPVDLPEQAQSVMA